MEARARTLLLISCVSDEDLRRQHSPLMSPIVWDLGHIAHFEEVWLLEKLDGGAASGEGGEGLRGIYNPFENPRSSRDSLALPSRSEAVDYLSRVRRAVLDRLPCLEIEGAERAHRPLLADGFVFEMVLQHEYQHDETILQALQLKKGEPYAAPRAVEAPGPARHGASPPPDALVRFPGGRVTVGTDAWGGAYDNERPRHPVELDPFWIGTTPVTEGDYREFVEDGGYERDELWSPDGRTWLDEGHRAPGGWHRTGDGWSVRVMDRVRPVDPGRPVCHVCFHEAEAYARWAGARLPTEHEWEAAASWDPATDHARRYPWGEEPPTPTRANLDQLAFDTAPIGSYPENVSPVGCYGMIGDVWEWTSSEFRPYPGYETFPYPEYSEVFFGEDFRVLRGGSWATRPGAVRNTFRNWDYPIRRQIFAGFRIARDD